MKIDYAWVRQICDEFCGTVLTQQYVVSYYRVRLTKTQRTDMRPHDWFVFFGLYIEEQKMDGYLFLS